MEKSDTPPAENEDVSVSDEGQVEQKQALSKNQLKKQMRIQKWAETKYDRRKKERQKVKERKRRKVEEKRRQGMKEPFLGIKKRKMTDPDASEIRVAVDCAYDSYMEENDIKKLLKQVQRCYAENRKSDTPLQFYLSNMNGETKRVAEAIVSGYRSWDVYFEEESPDVAFGAENIVYLAAESPNVLQDLQPDKVYIIGGLVDHNHHKGVCFDKVCEKGWSHAQLPIGDFVKLNSRKVLAVNHVFEIFLAYMKLGSWRDAFFQVLPSRKVTTFLPPEGDTGSKSPGSLESSDIDDQVSSKEDPCETTPENNTHSLNETSVSPQMTMKVDQTVLSADNTCRKVTTFLQTRDPTEGNTGSKSPMSAETTDKIDRELSPKDNPCENTTEGQTHSCNDESVSPRTSLENDQALISENNSRSKTTLSMLTLNSPGPAETSDYERMTHQGEESARMKKDGMVDKQETLTDR